MIEVPSRRAFVNRFEFAAAHAETLAQLLERYAELIPLQEPPAWVTKESIGKTVFTVSLPIHISDDRAVYSAINSLLNHMVEMGKPILEMARVEIPRWWTLWVRTG